PTRFVVFPVTAPTAFSTLSLHDALPICPQEVAERTLQTLKRTVPAAVPGIAFLSGEQSDELASEHLSIMNQLGGGPWALTFSYGRALQAAALKAWSGNPANVAAAQAALLHRARMNSLAAKGEYKPELERQAA